MLMTILELTNLRIYEFTDLNRKIEFVNS